MELDTQSAIDLTYQSQLVMWYWCIVHWFYWRPLGFSWYLGHCPCFCPSPDAVSWRSRWRCWVWAILLTSLLYSFLDTFYHISKSDPSCAFDRSRRRLPAHSSENTRWRMIAFPKSLPLICFNYHRIPLTSLNLRFRWSCLQTGEFSYSLCCWLIGRRHAF